MPDRYYARVHTCPGTNVPVLILFCHHMHTHFNLRFFRLGATFLSANERAAVIILAIPHHLWWIGRKINGESNNCNQNFRNIRRTKNSIVQNHQKDYDRGSLNQTNKDRPEPLSWLTIDPAQHTYPKAKAQTQKSWKDRNFPHLSSDIIPLSQHRVSMIIADKNFVLVGMGWFVFFWV